VVISFAAEGREELAVCLILASLPTLEDYLCHPSLVQLAEQSTQTQPPAPLAALIRRSADHHQVQRGKRGDGLDPEHTAIVVLIAPVQFALAA
jgi:hypothetical protein